MKEKGASIAKGLRLNKERTMVFFFFFKLHMSES